MGRRLTLFTIMVYYRFFVHKISRDYCYVNETLYHFISQVMNIIIIVDCFALLIDDRYDGVEVNLCKSVM